MKANDTIEQPKKQLIGIAVWFTLCFLSQKQT